MTTRRCVLQGAAGVFSTLACPAIVRAKTPSTTLSLLFDASNSMYTGAEQQPDGTYLKHALIQRDGHVKALLSEPIAEALVQNRVLVRLIAWNEQVWEFARAIRIGNMHDVEVLCASIMQNAPDVSYGAGKKTMHKVGIELALKLPHESDRHIIDISTDETVPPSDSVGCVAAREAAESRGAQINALAVGLNETQSEQLEMLHVPAPAFWYQQTTGANTLKVFTASSALSLR